MSLAILKVSDLPFSQTCCRLSSPLNPFFGGEHLMLNTVSACFGGVGGLMFKALASSFCSVVSASSECCNASSVRMKRVAEYSYDGRLVHMKL